MTKETRDHNPNLGTMEDTDKRNGGLAGADPVDPSSSSSCPEEVVALPPEEVRGTSMITIESQTTAAQKEEMFKMDKNINSMSPGAVHVKYLEDPEGRKTKGLRYSRTRVLEYLEDPEKVVSSNRVLEYLEDPEEADAEADPESGVAAPASPNRRVQAPPGAYAGSFGDGYARLDKVQDCDGALRRGSSRSFAENDLDVDSPIVLEATLESEGNQWWQQNLFVVGCGIVSLLIILSIVTTVALVLGKPSDNIEMQEGPHSQEPIPLEEMELGDLIPGISNATINAILQDPLSQQLQAYDFITNDPDWLSYEDWAKQQRFAMACIFFGVSASGPFRSSSLVPEQNKHECSWISSAKLCNDVGKVTALDILPDANSTYEMVGTIPPEIAFLSHLEQLEISDVRVGNLGEAMPDESIQSFPPITDLKLYGCELEGTIPSALGLLTNLINVDLSKNSLTGRIPDELGNLSKLSFFVIEDNEGLEPFLPDGMCSKDRAVVPWIQTSWCKYTKACCRGASWYSTPLTYQP